VRGTARNRSRLPANFGAADAQLAEALDNLDGADNYAAWICDMAEPFLGPTVLEIGAGHGTMTQLLIRKQHAVVASELSERCIGVLQDRFAGEPSVSVLHGDIGAAEAGAPYDSVLMINVLEHIEDSGGALRQIAGLLKPGGSLVVWVPAFDLLYSEFDRKIGHHRRYRRRQLQAELDGAGLETRDIRYANMAGAFGWLLVARILKRTPTGGRPVEIHDRWILPVTRRVESTVRAPFGQSLFAAAVKSRV
jgi:SAM-dependent methyltransferase